jgi:hypothetical protein
MATDPKHKKEQPKPSVPVRPTPDGQRPKDPPPTGTRRKEKK